MINKIYKFMNEFNMIADTDNIVVGVSGGADSVCLFSVLNALASEGKLVNSQGVRINITAVHVNHGIRGEEAKRDEMFSVNLCEQGNVMCLAKSVDVPKYATDNHLSEEEAGRILRYKIFNQVASEKTRCKIAVAHHMNDQAETVVMNMLRGSSINGLAGMAPVRGNIIRPLLSVTRLEIEEYLSGIGQDYMTDSTNLYNDYTRNKIRNICIPYIEDNINGQAVRHIADAAILVGEAKTFIESLAKNAYGECVEKIDDALFVRKPLFDQLDICIKREVMRGVIENLAGRLKDVYRVNIDNAIAAMDLQVGKKMDIVYKIEGLREYEGVRFFANASKSEEFQDLKFIIPENLRVGDTFALEVNQKIFMPDEGLVNLCRIECQISESMIKSQDNDYTKFFDYDKIPYVLLMRKRREGDRLSLSGGSSKKLKKEFTDRKIPLNHRDNMPVIAHDNRVLWAVGMRRSSECEVEENTTKVLVMKLCVQKI